MGRIEIMTGRERRRFWSDDQKLAILSEVSAGTESIVDIARRHDIVPQQIYGWRRQFGGKRPEQKSSIETTFLPVTIVASEPSAVELPTRATPTGRSAKPSRIEVSCKGGRVLKVDAGIAADLLTTLIRSVEEA